MPKGKDLEPAREISEQLIHLARLLRSGGHAGGLLPAQWDALRYLARANRFSNAPIAVAAYLGATKGTVSQTVGLLARRGLVTKSARGSDKRSINLALTPSGAELLQSDPMRRLGNAIDELSGRTRRRLARAMDELLSAQAAHQKEPVFGSCPNCRNLKKGNPPSCRVFKVPLDKEDFSRLCRWFETRQIHEG